MTTTFVHYNNRSKVEIDVKPTEDGDLSLDFHGERDDIYIFLTSLQLKKLLDAILDYKEEELSNETA